jgi:hypothetical protein
MDMNDTTDRLHMRELTAHQILIEILEGWLIKSAATTPALGEPLIGECHLSRAPCAVLCRPVLLRRRPSPRQRVRSCLEHRHARTFCHGGRILLSTES